MAEEIERKFLLRNDSWRREARGIHYRQGYLSSVKERTVRVRIVGEQGFLTVKGVTRGFSRLEFEYEIPFADAEPLLEMCEKPIIEKKRYKLKHRDLLWEIDEFEGDNEGLILAEVELESEDQEIVLPLWIGEEVTADERYYNASLSRRPFKEWK